MKWNQSDCRSHSWHNFDLMWHAREISAENPCQYRTSLVLLLSKMRPLVWWLEQSDHRDDSTRQQIRSSSWSDWVHSKLRSTNVALVLRIVRRDGWRMFPLTVAISDSLSAVTSIYSARTLRVPRLDPYASPMIPPLRSVRDPEAWNLIRLLEYNSVQHSYHRFCRRAQNCIWHCHRCLPCRHWSIHLLDNWVRCRWSRYCDFAHSTAFPLPHLNQRKSKSR